MKNLFSIFATVILFAVLSFTYQAHAQAPNKMNYQAIVRNAQGNLVKSSSVGIKISVLKGTSSGTVVFSETHATSTNINGLATIEIGSGTPVSGTLGAINWGTGPYFLKTETDPLGGTNYTIAGTDQLLSVPYALFAANADANESVSLRVSTTGDTLFIVPGNYVFIPGISGANAQLPTVITNAVSNITSTKAYGNGNVTAYGMAVISETGICWSINQPPTIADNFVSSGVVSGSFLCVMNGLTANTTYFVRAYAKTSGTTYYGQTVMFTTTDILPIPTLTTTEVTGITETTALSGGYISADGGSVVTVRGVCWNTSPAPTTANSKTTNGTGNGVFTSVMNGLTLNTQYYVRGYATNANGTNYGAELIFKTAGTLASVTTTPQIGVTESSAILGGTVIAQGSASVTERGICFSTTMNPTIADSKVAVGSGLGVFSTPDARLLPLHTYFVRAYATNSVGTAYGANITFTTADAFYESFETGCLDASCGWSNPSGNWSLVTSNFVEGLYGLYTNTYGAEITFTRTLLASGFLTFWSINTFRLNGQKWC